MCVAFGVLGLRPLSDPDVWWHLRTGELIAHHGFTDTDPWSAASTNPWVLHEWGTELLMYLSQAIGGYRGLIALHAIGMFVLAILVARSVRRSAGPTLACIITGLSLLGLFLGTAERPQLVSWCLLAATVPALRRAVDERQAPWWFIPVIWVWANLHGLWVAGLFLFAALVLGLVIEVGLRAWDVYRPFLVVGLASAAVTMLTPAGPQLLLTPFTVRGYALYIAEWAPPSLLDKFFAPAFVLLAVLAVGWARHPVPARPTLVCLVVATCYLGFSYTRTIPVAVIVLAPLAAEVWSRNTERPAGASRRELLSLAISSAVFVGVVAMVLPLVPGVQRGAPWRASRTLDALPGRAHVLNEYDLGGWLLWTARDTSPSIDGRTEIYDKAYVSRYVETMRLKGDWRGFVDSERFAAAWLRTSTPLLWGLKSEGWTEIYRDDFSVIVVPPSQAS
jgi:hypothetical protein